ncbi:MAG: pilin [Candidatus Paceibacterota bacterium]
MNHKKEIILFFFIISFLSLSYGNVFALEVNWPVIAGLSIKSDSGIGDVARYFLTLSTAVGSIIMFGMIIKGGFDFMNAGGSMEKISSAKTKMIGSAIGMIILLGVFIILNNINPALVSPMDVETDCPMGIRRKVTTKYKDDKGKDQEKTSYLCYNTDQADIMKDMTGDDVSYEDLGSTYPLCMLREVIIFSEKDYKGEKKVIFKDNDPTNEDCPSANEIKLGNANSARIVMKKNGIYLYGRSSFMPECGKDHLTTADPPKNLCKYPSFETGLKKEGGIWKWKCQGEGDIAANCWTLPVGCIPQSIKVSQNFLRPVNAQYETLLLGTVEIDWDGTTEIEISSDPSIKKEVSADDLFIIKNVTHPELEHLWGDQKVSRIWKGTPSISGLLKPGKNVLEFYVKDWWSNHIGCSDVYLYWCKYGKAPDEDSDEKKDDEKMDEEDLEEKLKASDEDLGPLYYSKGEDDFSKSDFNDKARKMEIVNMGILSKGTPFGEGNTYFGEYYGAVLFSEPDYRGKCFSHSYDTIQKAIKNGGESLVVEKDLATGEKVNMKGNLSSMIVFKSPLNQMIDHSLGRVEFYAVPNCGNIERKDTEDKNKYDVCTVFVDPAINGYLDGVEKILFEESNIGACQDNFKTISGDHYPIQSFRINGSAGVVLKSDAGNCHYFDIKTNDRRGNCFTNLQDAFKTFLGQEK